MTTATLSPSLLATLLALTTPANPLSTPDDHLTIHPAPPGEPLSPLYTVTVNGQNCPVLVARVAPADPQRRWQAMDDLENSHSHFDHAAFASFDMAQPVDITVSFPEPIRQARLLPSSLGLQPHINGHTLRFQLQQPAPVTIEINDRWVEALHLFANPPEVDPPHPDDPNTLYFPPGRHLLHHRLIPDNSTLYLAPGALLQTTIADDEPFHLNPRTQRKNYQPALTLQGRNIRIRGRGILDGSACPTHARELILVADSANIDIEGIILRDSPAWTLPIRRSRHVRVRNVKIIGYRANSDGIDICNSRDILIENCFLRTLDDLIVVKTDKGDGPAQRIRVERCTLWNEVAHALSIGAEIRDDIADVIFRDCDIIHDKGREWSLRIFHGDAATVAGIRFEDIRVEDSQRLASLWIGQTLWSRDPQRGHIRDVSFSDIHATGNPLLIELVGFSPQHTIDGVSFCDVTLNGRPLQPADIQKNQFVRRVRIQP
ncbi:MAG: hypothetical protein KatS3mg108_0306 [Isosphaeraceae bacterium]|jgi:hypothetical protein|nr:MAG: hypothetical protein KatS3mg108_0306 [Isosphaeraceae bacterium]